MVLKSWSDVCTKPPGAAREELLRGEADDWLHAVVALETVSRTPSLPPHLRPSSGLWKERGLAFPRLFVGLVLLRVSHEVTGQASRKIPPASLAQGHRTMASHTCVNFSLLTVLRMM